MVWCSKLLPWGAQMMHLPYAYGWRHALSHHIHLSSLRVNNAYGGKIGDFGRHCGFGWPRTLTWKSWRWPSGGSSANGTRFEVWSEVYRRMSLTPWNFAFVWSGRFEFFCVARFNWMGCPALSFAQITVSSSAVSCGSDNEQNQDGFSGKIMSLWANTLFASCRVTFPTVSPRNIFSNVHYCCHSVPRYMWYVVFCLWHGCKFMWWHYGAIWKWYKMFHNILKGL